MIELEVARPEHSDQLKQFFEQFALRGLVELRLSRPGDFFAPYRIFSDDFVTYMLRGRDGQIQGIASFLFREVFVNGAIHKIAFATDLRINANRGPLLQWSQSFLPVIRSIYENHKVIAVFSAMNRRDPLLHNIFLRPRSPRRAWPRYHLYRRFDLVTLHGRFPWCRKPIKTIRVVRAFADLQDKLIDYLSDRAKYYPFASCWDKNSFGERMKRLSGIRLEDFWIALDSKDKVLGCLGSWSNRQLQELRPLRYSLVAHNFRQFLKFGRFLGWSRPLTKPPRSTGVESPLQFRYLVYPYAANEDVFHSLLQTAFDQLNSNEFLVYAHAEQDFRRRPPKGWIAASLPYSLYTLLPAEMPTPSFLDPSEVLNPELESYFYS